MKKQVSRFQHPNDKFFGILAFGDKESEVPSDAIVSITYIEKIGKIRFFINGILSNLVFYTQMKKNDGLIYTELGGSIRDFSGATLSVWRRGSMVPFRDTGIHKITMKYFRWVFGGKTQTYFLSFNAKGRIPSIDECIELAKKHGRYYSGNKLIRQSSRPN